jgi:MFS family permease
MTPAAPALLTLPDFRRLSAAALLGTLALVAEQVVLGWLALELTDSPLLVGVALGVRMAPLLVVGLPAGVLADRTDRLTLLRAANAAMALGLTALGTLGALGLVTFPGLLLLTFAVGCGRALQQVAQQAYAHDLVGAARLTEALAVLGIAMRLGGLVGALVAGSLLAAFGPGPGYLAVAAAYLLGAVVLPSREPGAARTAAPPRWVREGFAGFVTAARQERRLPFLMALTAAAEVLGFSHQTVLPSLARDVLHVGPQGLGVMTAIRQAGGVLGILTVTRLGEGHGRTAWFLGVLALFGAGVSALGLAPTYAVVLAVLLVVNAAGAIADVFSQSLIQQTVPAALRGRASGAWVLAIGFSPLGQLQIGALASWLGVAAALGSSGLALLAVVGAAALVAPRLRRV